MDNRYLFHGKRLDNGKWVVGYLRLFPNYHFNAKLEYSIQVILKNSEYKNLFVDPATIGQCTGLSAAKSYRGENERDRLIFEGDILEVQYLQEPFHVEWREGSWMLGNDVSIKIFHLHLDKTKIIGTIHDRAEGEE